MTKNIILTENAIKNIKNLKIEYDAINSGLRFGLSEDIADHINFPITNKERKELIKRGAK